MPNNELDWSELLEKKSLSEDEELCKKVRPEGKFSETAARHKAADSELGYWKDAKYQGGDPRHAETKAKTTRAGIERKGTWNHTSKKFGTGTTGVSGVGAKARKLAPMDKEESEELNCSENGQWKLDKKIREPKVNTFFGDRADADLDGAGGRVARLAPSKEGSVKGKKYQGGDPRHAFINGKRLWNSTTKTKAGQAREPVSREITAQSKKLPGMTSGVSNLRPKQHNKIS